MLCNIFLLLLIHPNLKLDYILDYNLYVYFYFFKLCTHLYIFFEKHLTISFIVQSGRTTSGEQLANWDMLVFKILNTIYPNKYSKGQLWCFLIESVLLWHKFKIILKLFLKIWKNAKVLNIKLTCITNAGSSAISKIASYVERYYCWKWMISSQIQTLCE